jgi:hypothetical protein
VNQHSPSTSRTRALSRLSVSLLSLMAAGILHSNAWAEDKESDSKIVTDRPDFVESSDVVGKGRVQMETSFAIERNHANGSKDRTYSTPTLFRFGIAEEFELRLETDGYIRARSEDTATGISQTQKGYADFSIGVKWHAMDGKDGSPSIGYLAHLDIDSGSSQFKGSGMRPSLRMVAEWELPNEMSLGVMPGLIWDKNGDTNKRFVAGLLGVVLGKSWNSHFRSFVEVAVQQLAHSEDGGKIATLNLGCAYLLSKDLQIDTAISKKLTNRTPDFSWTVGLSRRF